MRDRERETQREDEWEGERGRVGGREKGEGEEIAFILLHDILISSCCKFF